YMMNNIEMSKLFFSDIADYKDILKRVKSFTSGREMSYYGDDAFNNAMTRLYNTHSGVELTPKDYGYYTFTDYMNAVVVSDVYTVNDHLSSIKDASGNVL